MGAGSPGAQAPYRLTIREHPSYLHARADGELTPGNALRFLEDAYAACVQGGRGALLLEMCLEGPSLDAGSIFEVISQRVADGSKLAKIAYVECGGGDPAKARFAETVAVNRGVNVRLFPDTGAAARWLAARDI
ncbi:MAG TPA: hypothetical protein VEG27_15125 [Usitatibacter sp.]|nr:hypothetical protein [Usitatibacter sp.]